MENNFLNVPEISRVSDFEEGQAAQIFCENADWLSKIYWWSQPLGEEKPLNLNYELPQTPPEDAILIKPEEAFNQVLYFGQKQRIPGRSAILWIENNVGFSKPFRINRPDIWNLSVKKTYAGGTVAVFGKNLNRSSQDHRPYAILVNKENGNVVKLINATNPSYLYDAQEFCVEYDIPLNAPDGKYNLYVNAKRGTDLGWSKPVDFEICSNLSIIDYFNSKWNQTVSDTVKMPKTNIKTISAVAEGVFADRYEEIQSVIDEMSKQGGIVLLSAGVFGISKTLIVKPNVVLMGAGKGATTICTVEGATLLQDWNKVCFARRVDDLHYNATAEDWGNYMKDYPLATLVQLSTHSGIEGVTLRLGNGAANGVLIASDKNDTVENAFVNRIAVDNCGSTIHGHGDGMDAFGAHSAGIMCVSKTNNVVVWDSDIKALMPAQFLPARNENMKIVNNRFICSPKQLNETYFATCYGCVIAQNDFIGGRRTLMFQFGFDNNWVYQNRSIDVARSENAQEVYMAEHGTGFWSGKPVTSTADYFTVAKMDERTERYIKSPVRKVYAVIIDGRGLGQYRTVTSIDGLKLTVDKPWDVVPDETTVFTLMIAVVKNLWVDNNSSLSNGQTQLLYGAGLENVLAGHMIDLASGISLQAMYYKPGLDNNEESLIGVVAFNTISNCQVRSSGSGVTIKNEICGSFEPDKDDPYRYFVRTRGIFGNIVYRNAFDGSSGLIYKKNQNIWMEDRYAAGVSIGGAYNMVSKNHILNYDRPVRILYNCEGNLFDRNTYTNSGPRFTGDAEPCGTDKDRKWE